MVNLANKDNSLVSLSHKTWNHARMSNLLFTLFNILLFLFVVHIYGICKTTSVMKNKQAMLNLKWQRLYPQTEDNTNRGQVPAYAW